MPKYSQVLLALKTDALVLHDIPPFQWVFDLATLSNEKNKNIINKAKIPNDCTSSQPLTFSIKALLGCWTMQMFSRAEYWQDTRYSRFFGTGGWLVLGSSGQVRTPEKHYYSNSVIYSCSLNFLFSKCYTNICINLWKEIKTFTDENQSILGADKCVAWMVYT